jgi:hypothetical protein
MSNPLALPHCRTSTINLGNNWRKRKRGIFGLVLKSTLSLLLISVFICFISIQKLLRSRGFARMAWLGPRCQGMPCRMDNVVPTRQSANRRANMVENRPSTSHRSSIAVISRLRIDEYPLDTYFLSRLHPGSFHRPLTQHLLLRDKASIQNA